MTTEEEFNEFIAKNRDVIENMIAMQKGAAEELIGKEKDLAKEAYGHARTYAEDTRNHTEEFARSVIYAITDPEVQRHFMNMGLEFFLGMSALMSKAPVPDFVRESYDTTRSNMMDVACKANSSCNARANTESKKVNITIDDDSRRDVPEDVFKHGE